MADLLNEIQEDIKQERLEKIWSKGKYYIFTLIALILIATGSFVWWKKEQDKIAQKIGDQYYNILSLIEEDKKDEAIIAIDEIINSYKGNPKSVFLLQKASILIDQGKSKESLPIYKQIAEDISVSKEYRDMATILLIANAKNNFSDDELSESISKLNILISDTNTIWRDDAKRLKASILIKQGKLVEAQEIYENIASDINSPLMSKTIARSISEYLGGGIPSEVLKSQNALSGLSEPNSESESDISQ